METTILILIGILVLAIFLVIFRISNLATIIRSKEDNSIVNEEANNIHGYLFLILPVLGIIAATWYGMEASEMHQPVASAYGKEIDSLFWFSTGVIITMFVVTNAALFYFAFKYRYRNNQKAFFYPDNTRLEIIWTIVPAIILTALVFSGWRIWRKVTADAPANAQVIEIMGYQFAWLVRLPGEDNALGNYNFRYTDETNAMGIDFTDKRSMDDIVLNKEVCVVKNRPVALRIRARDVLHSVTLAHFRQKMDAVPGQPTKMWFTPTMTTDEMRNELQKRPEWNEINPKTGKARYETFEYEISCQEICGRGHFGMRFTVKVVETEEDYKKWLASQKAFAKERPEYVAEAIKKQQQIKSKGEAVSFNY